MSKFRLYGNYIFKRLINPLTELTVLAQNQVFMTSLLLCCQHEHHELKNGLMDRSTCCDFLMLSPGFPALMFGLMHIHYKQKRKEIHLSHFVGQCCQSLCNAINKHTCIELQQNKFNVYRCWQPLK